MIPGEKWDKHEDDEIRRVRMEKFKGLKSQQEIFGKMIQANYDFTTIPAKKHIQRGVPSRYRNLVWVQLSTNPHGITKDFYNLLLRKASKSLPSEATVENKLDSMKLIKNDVCRTFGELKLFSKNEELAETLQELLSAWVVFRPDIGYVQGMSSLAGFLLSELQDFEAFAVFTAIITNSPLFVHFTFQMDQVGKLEAHFQHTLRLEDKELHRYFQQNSVDPRLFLFEWVITLFTRCLEFETAGRVWDILLYEQMSEGIVLRVACGLLVLERETLLQLEKQQILKHLKAIKVTFRREEQLMKYLCREG